MLCLYLMGRNLSNRQLAQALELDPDALQTMTTQQRQGIIAGNVPVPLETKLNSSQKNSSDTVLIMSTASEWGNTVLDGFVPVSRV
jgi:hypothetical protein